MLAAPGVRSDCLGVDALLPAWPSPALRTMCRPKTWWSPRCGSGCNGAGDHRVVRVADRSSPRAYYEGPVRHQGITVDDADVNFPTRRRPADGPRCTWRAGASQRRRRLSVPSKRSRGRKRWRGVATISVTWANYGAAAATEKVGVWLPAGGRHRQARRCRQGLEDAGLRPARRSQQRPPASVAETVRADLSVGPAILHRRGRDRLATAQTERAPHVVNLSAHVVVPRRPRRFRFYPVATLTSHVTRRPRSTLRRWLSVAAVRSLAFGWLRGWCGKYPVGGGSAVPGVSRTPTAANDRWFGAWPSRSKVSPADSGITGWISSAAMRTTRR